MSESGDDSHRKSELCDVSAPMRLDSGESPNLCDVSDLLQSSALHTVNMRLHISLYLDLCRLSVEEAPDFEEIVPETPEYLLMEEFVAETAEASAGDLVTAAAGAAEVVEAAGADWRTEVVTAMLRILIPLYFKSVKSVPLGLFCPQSTYSAGAYLEFGRGFTNFALRYFPIAAALKKAF